MLTLGSIISAFMAAIWRNLLSIEPEPWQCGRLPSEKGYMSVIQYSMVVKTNLLSILCLQR